MNSVFPTCSHVTTPGKTGAIAIPQVVPNALKKFRQWIKRWIKNIRFARVSSSSSTPLNSSGVWVGSPAVWINESLIGVAENFALFSAHEFLLFLNPPLIPWGLEGPPALGQDESLIGFAESFLLFFDYTVSLG